MATADIDIVSKPHSYDFVIFGASGFTGQYVVEEVARTAQEEQGLKWAISGRNKSKLQTTLKTAAEETGLNLNDVPIIVANVDDDASLRKMAQQAKVVLNCVGPYRKYGEQVVKACVEYGTSHVDISGEPQFLEQIQLDYHKAAQEKNAYVVGACGFDSIPADMGITFLQDSFGGDVNSVEMYMGFRGSVGGALIHSGTLESALGAIGDRKELRSIRQQLYPDPLPKLKPRLQIRHSLHYSENVKSWCLRFQSDLTVVRRTQRYFYDNGMRRPVQAMQYYQCNSLFSAIATMIWAVLLFSLGMCKKTRAFITKHCELFTAGLVSHAGPTREAANSNEFTYTLIGNGWEEKLAEPGDQHKDDPNKTLIVEVKGQNPGYGATCVCMVQSALVILREPDKLPPGGGVYPPGAAFVKTSLIERLHKHGVTFSLKKD